VIEVMTNILLAFPALLLAIFIVTFSDNPNSTSSAGDTRSIGPIILALSILAIPPLTRLVRANTIMYSQREFVIAARSIGAPNKRILFREISAQHHPDAAVVRAHRPGPVARRRRALSPRWGSPSRRRYPRGAG
jgi:peptide/nickel transport system permease protein